MVRGYAATSSNFKLVGKGTAQSGGGTAWTGMTESGSVTKNEEDRFTTPELPAGRYLFDLTGSGGDADLYVRVGVAPTTTGYDCRPYKSGSNESCSVELAAAAKVHVMVRGYATSSSYQLKGSPQ